MMSGPLQGAQVGPSPVDRGRGGSKHHLLCDTRGVPLAVKLTGTNRNDVTQLAARSSTPSGRCAASAAERLAADRGYDRNAL